MTRIASRYISPNTPADSFSAKPKIFYIAGATYSRTEEQPDLTEGIHGLIVVAEPDVWMVNLISGIARHLVDPGPTFITHHNILKRDAPKVFSSLEFGNEIEFFRAQHAMPLKAQLLDGQHCEASEFRHANYRIVLFVRTDTHKPFHLDVFSDDNAFFSIRYLNYQTDLPFDSTLFKPPPGVTILEAKPPNTR